MGGGVKRCMFVNRRAPHGSLYACEGLELALTAAAFDQAVSLAFLDDGVFQLVAGQQPEALGFKNFALAFKALPDYGVTQVYVERESLEARALSPADLCLTVQLVAADELARLMREQDLFFSF